MYSSASLPFSPFSVFLSSEDTREKINYRARTE